MTKGLGGKFRHNFLNGILAGIDSAFYSVVGSVGRFVEEDCFMRCRQSDLASVFWSNFSLGLLCSGKTGESLSGGSCG